MTQSTMRLTVNGKTSDVDAAPDTALLYVLRNELSLNAAKNWVQNRGAKRRVISRDEDMALPPVPMGRGPATRDDNWQRVLTT